jgi:NTP pyrophosphatase (non-canonical NTP hydrolase)
VAVVLAQNQTLSMLKIGALNKGATVLCERQRSAPELQLEEMKREIETLVIAKGFYNRPEDIPKKLLFAFIELGEASDAWKKGLPQEKIAEELIDVIFYILDASRLACPNMNMDDVFKKKLEKNLNRPYQYGEGHRAKQPEANGK